MVKVAFCSSHSDCVSRGRAEEEGMRTNRVLDFVNLVCDDAPPVEVVQLEDIFGRGLKSDDDDVVPSLLVLEQHIALDRASVDGNREIAPLRKQTGSTSADDHCQSRARLRGQLTVANSRSQLRQGGQTRSVPEIEQHALSRPD